MSIMDGVSKEFELPIIQRDTLLAEMRELLVKYDYDPSDEALIKIIEEWSYKKGWLINLFSQHPNWNPEKFQIQFNQDFTRCIDRDTLHSVLNWAMEQYTEIIRKSEIKIAGMTLNECNAANNRLSRILQALDNLNFVIDGYVNIILNGKSRESYDNEYVRLQRIYNKFCSETSIINIYCNDIATTPETKKKYENYLKFRKIIFDYFESETNNLCPVELRDKINFIFPNTAKTGQKISKIIAKVMNILGVDTIKDMREVWHNGVSQMKDFGWAKKQAELGDAINPLKYTRHTIISLNPIDYLTMSFGHGWASCHTIDKHNRRRNGSDNYHGCYSSGTISYMLDDSSLIFYTVDEKYDGKDFELEDKMQRVVFALGNDKLYEGRVYPDGRDGGDLSLSGQFRNVMQKIIADCLEVNNLWINKKGTNECRSIMKQMGGTAYPDWENYDDCNISYLKGEDGQINNKYICINETPISIVTGEQHTYAESITGDDEDEYVECEHCGYRININDALRIGDYYYCDGECAESEGYIWCDDVQEYIYEDEVYCDELTGRYFADTSEMVRIEYGWETFYYRTPENAEEDGYIYCENTENWIKRDDAYYDNERNEYFEWTDDSIRTEDGCFFIDEDSATDAGYHERENGDWTNEEEEAEAV